MLAHMRKSEEEIGIGKESRRYGLRQALVSARVYSAVPPVFHRDSGQQDVAGGQQVTESMHANAWHAHATHAHAPTDRG